MVDEAAQPPTTDLPATGTVRILDHCTGCGRCVAACRHRALSMETEFPNGFGRKQASLDPRRCNGCGACLPACPHLALTLEEG